MRILKRLIASDYIGVGLLCFGIMVYQLSMTRMLSVICWYHYTFLILSIVMLGMGAPGLWLSRCKQPQRLLPYFLLGGSASLLLSNLFIIDAASALLFQHHALFIFCIIISILVPMLCLGSAVCIYLMKAEGTSIGRMYAADLVGAFSGAALIIPLITLIPVPKLIALLAFLPLLAMAHAKPYRMVTFLLAVAIASIFVWPSLLTLRYAKYYDEKNLGVIYEKWTPTARITVMNKIFFMPQPQYGFAWGAGGKFPLVPKEQYWMEQDGTAGSPITRFEGFSDHLDYLLYDVTAVPYLLRPSDSVAIIGGGGGRDILTAMCAGIDDINVIEVNSGIVETLSNRFRDFSGDIYHQNHVHPFVAEGRSYLASTDKTYDLIQISMIDSWAAAMAGAFSLVENNLYTEQAYRAYFQKLKDNGMVATSRWFTGFAHFEIPRLVLLIYDTLKDMGIDYPQQHIVVVVGGKIGTVIASKSPFTEADIRNLHAISQNKGFRVIYPPADPAVVPDSTINDIMSGRGAALVQRMQKQGLNLAPPTDDKPFFFNIASPLSFRDNAHKNINMIAISILQDAVLIVMAITIVLFFLPFIFNQWWRQQPFTVLGAASVYFAMTGAGFMMMEIYLIQRFVLYLGHPSYSASLVLSSLLLGLGSGAYASAKLPHRFFKAGCFVMPTILALIAASTDGIFAHSIGYAWIAKILITFGLIYPAGFMAGFFFPVGVVLFGNVSLPWFWTINGSFSVLASAISLPAAMEWGFFRVAEAAVICYLIACLMLGFSRKFILQAHFIDHRTHTP